MNNENDLMSYWQMDGNNFKICKQNNYEGTHTHKDAVISSLHACHQGLDLKPTS
jgi:hypothetical protein